VKVRGAGRRRQARLVAAGAILPLLDLALRDPARPAPAAAGAAVAAAEADGGTMAGCWGALTL
jgi:hypothetical protein